MRKNRLFLLLLLLVSLFTLAACSQGAQGEAGDKGPAGDKGITGDTGATGDKGADGQNSKAPEFKVDNDGLQWRFEGTEEWKLLISIPDLIGYSEKYTISFDTNGGDALEALGNQVWKSTAELPVATKEGYTFLGWQKIEEGALEGDVYAENKFPSVQDDVELKAVWGATVSYAEETAKEAVVLKAGEATTLPAMEAPEGKTFLGWSYDGYTLEAAGAEIVPTTNRHYVPVYNYTITYELNGGEGAASEDVATAEIGKLPVPTKAGHVFQGWYTDAELTKVAESKPVGDITLYAKWLEVTYVNYNLNGGTFAVAPYASIDAFAEEIVALFNSTGKSDAVVTTREGFQGSTHPNVKYVFSKAENLEKYQWLIQLALDAVNASGKPDTDTYGSGQTIATYKEMLTAMLAGDTNAINGSYADGRSAFRQFIHRLINIGGTEGNKGYNEVTFDFAVEENIAKVNDIMGLPAPKFSSFDAFVEEFLEEFNTVGAVNLTAAGFADGSGTAIKTTYGNAEFLAKWSWLAQLALDEFNAIAAEKGYTDETKMPSGGTMAHYKQMLTDIVAGDTTAISGADYPDARTCFRQFIQRLINKGDASAPGKTPYNDYTVDYSDPAKLAAFNASIGLVKQVVFSESAALATPTRDGYIFAGWFDAEGNEVKSVTIGDGNTTIDVTAKWQAYHNVSFDLDGGYYLNPAEGTNTFVAGAYDAINWGNYNTYISAGTKGRAWWYHVTLKETAVAGIYEVTGKGSSASAAATFAEGEIGLLYCDDHKTSIPELFALVSGLQTGQLVSVSNIPAAATNAAAIDVTVFSADSSLENYSMIYNEDVAQLPVPTKEGFAFLGWFNGETKVESITITESATYTLVAKWQATHTVSFDLNGGELPKEIAGEALYTVSVNVYKNGWTDDKPQFADATIKDAGSSYIWAPKVFLVYNASINAYEVVEKAPADGASSIQGATSAWTHCLLYVSDTEYETIQVGQYFVADAEISVGCAPFKLSAYAGLAEAQTKFVYAEDVTELPVPTREGCTFLGWFNGETKVESITIGTESATYTLVAKWEKPILTKLEIPGSLPLENYITNNAQYPNPEFYSNGLKLRFVNQGVLTDKFAAQSAVNVTLTINSLHNNTKSESSTETDAFTVYGLNEAGEVVATASSNAVAVGEMSFELTGEGIVQVKVIMTDFFFNGTACVNVNLGGVIVR